MAYPGQSLATASDCELLNVEFFPEGVDSGFDFGGHGEHGGPGACEAFGGPFAGGVDAHFGAEVGEAGGVVKRVDGAQGELNVAFGVDVVGGAEGDFGEVVGVAVFVDDDDALGEHGLAEGPDAAHDFAGVAGVGLADGDDHEVVEDGFGRKADVDDLGQCQLHEGEEDALDGFAHPGVFHGGLADDSGGVDGVFAVGDAGEVEDGVVVGHGVEAGVIAEGAFGAEFGEVDVAFEDVFGVGGDFEVDGFGLDELGGFGAEEAGDEVFLDFGWGGDDGGEGDGGVCADGDGDFEAVGLDFGDGLLRERARDVWGSHP